MLKYFETDIRMEEVPGEISLVISITGCPGKCPGCHSPWLQTDIGNYLTLSTIEDELMINYKNEYKSISCICLLGGDNDIESICRLGNGIKSKFPTLKTAVYSGRYIEDLSKYEGCFDYVKEGPYIEEKGGLNKQTTNQKMWEFTASGWKDITYKFWE